MEIDTLFYAFNVKNEANIDRVKLIHTRLIWFSGSDKFDELKEEAVEELTEMGETEFLEKYIMKMKREIVST